MNTEYNTVLASLCTYWESYDTVEYVDVMVEVLWMPEIEEVTKIEFYNNGKEHTLDISIDSGIVDFKLDGQKISEENGRRLYVRVLSIFAVNSAEGKEYGEMEYKYTMYMKSGETHVMELFPINIRQYAVKVDGVLTFYASINAVDRITNAIQTVLNGGTLSSTF